MKLLITDLDGTLLDEITTFSHVNEQALMKAKAAGYEIVIASGRMRENMSEIGLDVFEPYAIAMNGAIVYDQKKNILFEYPLAYEQIMHVVTYCEAQHHIYLLYTQHEIYIKLPDNIEEQIDLMSRARAKDDVDYEEHKAFFHEMYAGLPAIDETFKQLVKNEEVSIYKIEVIGPGNEVLSSIDHEFNSEFSISSSWITNRELTALNVNKGEALKALCEQLHLTLDDCVAMGDNRNDLEMLQYAGFSVAMDNASDEIKQHCDYVSCPCDEHGVAKAIDVILQTNS